VNNFCRLLRLPGNERTIKPSGPEPMSASDLSVAEPRQLEGTRQDKIRGWLTLGTVLFVVGLPLYGIYWLRELYLFQPNLENAGGSVQLAVVGPQWLREFAGHDRDWLFGTPVRLFAPKREKVDDRWARRLARMTRLQTLGLANTKITDRGMTALAPLTELEDLDLSNTAVGDAGLEQLQGLGKLQILSLAGTQTSDEGLAGLAHLERLTVLDLSGTRVRGPGLQHLAGMRSLR
jgi:hypothetical protein